MGEDTCDLQDTGLHDAVRYGDIDEVQVALNHGLDPNQIGMYEWTPLHEAACNGDREISEKLLDHGGTLL
jgi:ankyrin repeat protein